MKKFFANLFLGITASVKRFLPSFIFSLLFFIAAAAEIIKSSDNFERLMMTFVFGFFFTLMADIIFENVNIKLNRALYDLLFFILALCVFLVIYNYETNPYIPLGFAGVLLSVIVTALYFACRKNFSDYLSYILKNIIFSGFVCLIVTAGIMLCLFAFDKLIFSFSSNFEPYAIAAEFIWIVLFSSLCLSGIPKKNDEIILPKLFKVFNLYVALPVYLLLIAILYIYLIKIIITFSFPSGQINWLGSFAALFFLYFLFVLDRYKEEVNAAKLYVRWSGLLIIPVFIMQFIAVYIRISNYGFTMDRYISLFLNIVVFIFAVFLLFFKEKTYKYLFFAVIFSFLVLSVTPFNAIKVPILNQYARFTAALREGNMLTDGNVTPNENAKEEIKYKIYGAYNYLISNEKAHNLALVKSIEKSGANETFGFVNPGGGSRYSEDKSKYCSFKNLNTINIEGYKTLAAISVSKDSSKLYSEIGEKNKDFKLEDYAKSLYAKYGEGTHNDIVMDIPLNDCKLVINDISITIKDGEVVGFYCNGYVLKN